MTETVMLMKKIEVLQKACAVEAPEFMFRAFFGINTDIKRKKYDRVT